MSLFLNRAMYRLYISLLCLPWRGEKKEEGERERKQVNRERKKKEKKRKK
jgi:hypothetical protein